MKLSKSKPTVEKQFNTPLTRRTKGVMKPIRKRIKLIAAFFIVNFLSSLFAPNIAYALTSGPTAPESFSFEPVDTTDLVNLQTGDFVYNVPLLEIPGPAGSFPLSLSYHAGIQNDLDASWVGLGWTLNPGAISRYVNGQPDDHRGITTTQRDFWEGGETTYNSYGISFGIGDFASVSANVITASDSYRGTGLGYSLGIGLREEFSPIGIGASFGRNPFGGYTASASLTGQAGYGPVGVAGSVGLSYNEDSGIKTGAGLSGGISLPAGKSNSVSLLGASINTNSSGVAVSAFGASSSQHNSRSGNISTRTSSSGFSLPLPVVPGLSLNYSRTYIRYWIDETEGVEINGSLYTEKKSDYETAGFDTYEIENKSPAIYRLLPGGGSEQVTLRSLPIEMHDRLKAAAASKNGVLSDYDVYNVNAQGLTGSMRPYNHQVYLNQRTLKREANGTESYDLKNLELGGSHNMIRPKFRFVGDFSNAMTQEDHNADARDGGAPLSLQFNGEVNSFELSVNPSTNIQSLPGSKHIAPVYESGGNSLKGFIITNESGVKYEFMQPVYSFDEHVYSENIDKRKGIENDQPVGGHAFNHLKKPERYAYSWLLTAMKGPDYVDRTSNGVSKDDWGYWVEFEYGMWTDKYGWRTPDIGFNKDVDNNFQSFSQGYKELYYLDAIKTATHTALFVKSIREDAHGIARDRFFQYNGRGGVSSFETVHATNATVKNVDDGGYDPVVLGPNSYLFPDNITPQGDCEEDPYYRYPLSTLKLDKIILVDNSKLDNTNINKDDGNTYYSFKRNINSCGNRPNYLSTHYSSNILDIEDISGNTALINNSLRTVEFEHDYSLSKGTPNSFSNVNLYRNNPSPIGTRGGKLTLKQLTFKGKSGAQAMPPQKFGYNISDYQDGEIGSAFLKSTTDIELDAPYNFEIGDLVYVNVIGGSDSYARIISKSDDSNYRIKKIGGLFANATRRNMLVSKTKNPPYSSVRKDLWGFYKSDFRDTGKNNLDKITTEVSGKNVDVWSLRSITSPLGATTKINYESDTYGKSVFTKSYPYTLDDPTFNPGTNVISGELDYLDGITSGGSVKIFYKEYPSTNTCVERNSSGECVRYGVDYDNPIMKYLEVDVSSFSVSGSNVSFSASIPKSGVFNEIEIANVNIHFNKQPFYGGGLRVASIENESVGNSINRINYQYHDISNPSLVSSGVTSYEPIITDPVFEDLSEDEKRIYAHEFGHDLLGDVLTYGRFIPGPGVFYKNVTITQDVLKDDVEVVSPKGRTEYEFYTYESNMLYHNREFEDSDPDGGSYNGTQYTSSRWHKLEIKDYSAIVGALKTVRFYDTNDNLFTESETGYLYQDEASIASNFENQGVIEEAYANARFIKDYNDDFEAIGVISYVTKFPTIQVGEKHTNFRTGISTINRTIEFDKRSGLPIKTISSDGYGTLYLNSITPAYKIPAYTDMKSKNLLTQIALEEIKKVSVPSFTSSADFDEEYLILLRDRDYYEDGLISSKAYTWKKYSSALNGTDAVSQGQSNIWRRNGSYTWIGDENTTIYDDGSARILDYSEFNFSNLVSNSSWQKNSEITLYDVNSHALEVKDVNGNFAATRFDLDNARVQSTIANAQYDQFNSSGFEVDPGANGKFTTDIFGEGVFLAGSASVSEVKSHTGKKSLYAPRNTTILTFSGSNDISSDKPLKISVWSTSNHLNYGYYNGGGSDPYELTTISDKKSGEWYLHEKVFDIENDGIYLWIETTENCYIDDFRVHPIGAPMTSYVYNEWGELSHTLDANNLYTHYEYDPMGRLEFVTRETLSDGPVLVSESRIHYGSVPNTVSNLYGSIFAESTNSNRTYLSINFSEEGSGDYHYRWNVDGTIRNTTVDRYRFNTSSTFRGSKDVKVTVTDNVTGLKFSAYREDVQFNYCTPSGWIGDPYCEMRDDDVSGTLCFSGNIVRNWSLGNCQGVEVRPYTGSTTITCSDTCSDTCPPGQICPIEQFDEN